MNQDKIWEAYQNDAELQEIFFPGGSRIDYIAKKVPTHSKALNIGVGAGDLERLLASEGVDVFCLDPSETSVERLRQEIEIGQKAKTGYSQDIPFDDEIFDFVIMTEVLEHLSDDVLEATLREVPRVLRQGGTFIGSVPADENLKAGLVVCTHCGERFHRWGHQQSFSQQALNEKLSATFSQVHVKRVVFADFKRLNWKGKLSFFARKIQALIGLRGSNQNFYFHSSK